MKVLPSADVNSHSVSFVCPDHHLEIDPLQTPLGMRCPSCGAVEALSNLEIRWPSGQFVPKRFRTCRRALRKALTVAAMLTILAILVWTLADRTSQDAIRSKAAKFRSKISTLIERGQTPLWVATKDANEREHYAAQGLSIDR